MKIKVIIISLCPLLAWSICAAAEVEDMGKQTCNKEYAGKPF